MTLTEEATWIISSLRRLDPGEYKIFDGIYTTRIKSVQSGIQKKTYKCAKDLWDCTFKVRRIAEADIVIVTRLEA